MRAAHVTGLAVALLLLGFALAPAVAEACRCVPPASVATLLARSSATFTGKVTRLETKGDTLHATLVVERAWKGATAGEPRVVVTSASPASCGYAFQSGGRYLVFAEADRVSSCGGTRPLAKVSAADLAALDAAAPPRPADACVCPAREPMPDMRLAYDAIFEGKVVAHAEEAHPGDGGSPGRMIAVTLRVGRVWDGNVRRGRTAKVYTSPDRGVGCGLELRRGVRYLVAARRYQDRLIVSQCTETTPATSAQARRIRAELAKSPRRR